MTTSSSERLSPSESRILDEIESDMAERPWRISPMRQDLLDRARGLVADVDPDLDAALTDEDGPHRGIRPARGG